MLGNSQVLVSSPSSQIRTILWLSALMTLLVLATLIFAASFGVTATSIGQVIDIITGQIVGDAHTDLVSKIVIELRLPRILLAFVAGYGLAVSGLVLQTVTRNALADPYLFGISSGASFGAVVVITLLAGVKSTNLAITVPIGAFFGACLSVAMVLALCGRHLSNQIERMLLSGVATSFMFGAMTSLLLYFSGPQMAASVLFWSLGSFAKASWDGLWLPLVVVSGATIVILLFKRQIIAMKAGDETAHTLGFSVPQMRLWMLLLCSLITAVLVANCGGIGFVGLMIPHIVRQLLPRQFSLLTTGFVGGLFMVWVDVLARCIIDYQELPVGIITAIIGSLFFLVILATRRSD